MPCKCPLLWAVIRDRLEQSNMNHPSSKCTLFFLPMLFLSLHLLDKQSGVDVDRARQRISFAFCLALFFLFLIANPFFHFWSSQKTSTDPEIQAEGWRIWRKQLEEYGFTRRPMCPFWFFVVHVKFVVETKHCDYFLSSDILPSAIYIPFRLFHSLNESSIRTHTCTYTTLFISAVVDKAHLTSRGNTFIAYARVLFERNGQCWRFHPFYDTLQRMYNLQRTHNLHIL